MNSKRLFSSLSATALVLVLMAGLAGAQGPGDVPTTAPAASPLSASFTYQGQLESDGSPYTGTCDLRFKLWDAVSGGSQVGPTQTKSSVDLEDGYFTVELDFGSSAFQGDARWLDISVRCPAGTGGYTPLTPRQPVTAAPYGLYSLGAPWSGLSGVPAGFADGVDDDTTYSAGTGLYLLLSTFHVDTTYVQRRVSGECNPGNAIRVVNGDGTVVCQPIFPGGDYWSLSGNAGTTPGTHYLGTSDDVALELKVNGERALRLEPHADSPNVIGGSSANWVQSGKDGATIGGGGSSGGYEHSVTDHWGTVGGGIANTASGFAATVAGGRFNHAGDDHDTVAGGFSNTASAGNATIGGGVDNEVTGAYSTVPGGEDNVAEGYYSFAAGRRAQALHNGTFVWADSENADFASTLADQFSVRAANGARFYADSLEVGAFVFNLNGDGANPGEGTAIRGRADASSAYGVAGHNYWDGVGVGAWSYSGNLIEAYDGDFPNGTLRFYIDQDGNVHYDGTLMPFVTMPPVVVEGKPTPDGEPAEHRELYGLAATEVWFEDLGTAQLQGGEATVPIDTVFAGAVNLDEDYHVFLTPLCDQAVLLFVTAKTPAGFTVKGVTLDGEPSSCSFDYRVVAKRLDYEDLRLEIVDIPDAVIVEREAVP